MLFDSTFFQNGRRPSMQLRKTLRATAFLAALALPVLGCSDDDDTTGPGDETTALTVQMTDAAGDFHAAVVTISQLYLVGSGDNAHVALVSSPVTVNLTDLANAAKTLVNDADVPNGTYSEMRVVISGAYVEVENDDGSTSIYASSTDYAGLPAGATVAGTLALPTDANGIAVTLPSGALTYAGDDTSLLLDFEASRSFSSDGAGGWTLAPVIQGGIFTEPAKARAWLTLGDGVTLPDIGDDTPTLADFRAVLTTSDGATEQQSLADADLDGTYEADFDYVLPGDYTVTFEGPAGLTVTTDPVTPIAVTTAAGASVDASATITGATVTPP
jgi:hypothetical protein